MKQKILFALCLSLLFSLIQISYSDKIDTAGNQKIKKNQTKENSKMILVVYYSRTGNTKKVAEDIASRLNADIERIIDKKNRKGFLGFLGAVKDALFKKLTRIEKIEKNPADYDIIIIGTPIWAGTMTPAVRTYIIQYKDSFKQIACFTTAGSDRPDKTVKKMENIAGKESIGFVGFIEKELKPKKKDIYEEKLSKFLLIFK